MNGRQLRAVLEDARLSDYLSYGGAALAVLGAFAPWVTFGPISLGGLSVHGLWVLIVAPIGGLAYHRVSLGGAALCFGLVLVIGIYELVQINSDFGAFGAVGWGVYALILGAVGGLSGAKLAAP